MAVEIVTNNHWREFVLGHEVPESVHDDYDWLNDDERLDGWFRYRGRWYHLSDFLYVQVDSGMFERWDGYLSDSFFSGVVIKVSEDGEFYKVGTFYSKEDHNE